MRIKLPKLFRRQAKASLIPGAPVPQIREIDRKKALGMLAIVQAWAQHPDRNAEVSQALAGADNSLMALVLTGVNVGLFPNTPQSNKFILDKLKIAFQMGYYSHSIRVKHER